MGGVAGAAAAVLDSARASLGGVLELAPKKTRIGKHKKKIKSKSAVKKARKREAKAAASAAAVAAAAATPPKRKTPPAREGEAPPAAAAVGNEGEEHVESVRGLLDGAAPKVVAEMLLVNACFEIAFAQANPNRPESATYTRYEAYKKAKCGADVIALGAVSYTHLTLPPILLV